jgi:hypothetical protein
MAPPTVEAIRRAVTRFPPAVDGPGTAGPAGSGTLVAVLADAVPYTGHTTEDRRIVVDVRGRVVVGVRAGIGRYPCETFGDVGPLVVRASDLRAPIRRDGRFRVTTGEPAQRISLSGTLRRRTGRITGTVRVRGSIATGQRCASATLRFAAARG